jgi:hypothetical protein
MNAYEGMMTMIKLDGEMQNLGNRLNNVKTPTEKEIINKRMKEIDIEFINLKHSLELTEIKIIDYNKIFGGK